MRGRPRVKVRARVKARVKARAAARLEAAVRMGAAARVQVGFSRGDPTYASPAACADVPRPPQTCRGEGVDQPSGGGRRATPQYRTDLPQGPWQARHGATRGGKGRPSAALPGGVSKRVPA